MKPHRLLRYRLPSFYKKISTLAPAIGVMLFYQLTEANFETFDEWVMQEPSPENRGINDTPVGDGVPNLAKYALGGEGPQVNGRNLLPEITSLNDEKLAYVFTRSTRVKDLTYIVESSPNLKQWATVSKSVSGNRFTAETRKVRVTEKLKGDDLSEINIFFRLRNKVNPEIELEMTPRIAPHYPTPKWMGEDGVVYGTSGTTSGRIVFRSHDYWDTSEELFRIPSGYGGLGSSALLVSSSGRVVVCTMDGHVFVSDVNQHLSSNAEPVFTFESGYPNWRLAHTSYDNVILLGAYGDYNVDNPPREVFMSTDSGETWRRIFYPEIEGLMNAARYHIHDVEYDPYGNIIWVAIGDVENTQIYYSRNEGISWHAFFEYPAEPGTQVTQIIAFSHGVVFGSDSPPDGLRYWPRRSRISSEDMDFSFFSLGHPEDRLYHFATRRWQVREGGREICLLPWIVDNQGPTPKLLFTKNGKDWQIVYRGESGTGFTNVIGPHPGCEDAVVLGIYTKDGIPHVFRGSIRELID